jgi:hypothetical protein
MSTTLFTLATPTASRRRTSQSGLGPTVTPRITTRRIERTTYLFASIAYRELDERPLGVVH